MKRLVAYLLASSLCLLGCTASLSMPPQVAQPDKNTEEIKPFNLFDEWFIRTTTENDPYPSVCSLHRFSGSLVGSGILIRPDVVLTAGHCIDDDDIFSVVIGQEEIMVKDIVLHPRYSDSSGRIINDVGLIFLECDSVYEPATIGCIEWIERYEHITTVGYSMGYKKYSKHGVFKFFGRVMTEPNYMKFIPRPASVMPGDSGGGVFVKYGDAEYVIGIISSYSVVQLYDGQRTISECSAAVISNYLNWIDTEILKNEIRTIDTVNEDGR